MRWLRQHVVLEGFVGLSKLDGFQSILLQVNSGGQKAWLQTEPFWGPYAITKAGLEAMARVWAVFGGFRAWLLALRSWRR